jgi:hypothetical protein
VNISTSRLDVPGANALAEARLHAPEPSPVRGSSVVRFDLPRRSHVRLSVHDVQGRELARLADDVREAGAYRIALDGAQLPAGLCFIRMRADGVDRTVRAVILK